MVHQAGAKPYFRTNPGRQVMNINISQPGKSDVRYFSQIFLKFTGVLPKDYKSRHELNK